MRNREKFGVKERTTFGRPPVVNNDVGGVAAVAPPAPQVRNKIKRAFGQSNVIPGKDRRQRENDLRSLRGDSSNTHKGHKTPPTHSKTVEGAERQYPQSDNSIS